MENRIREIRAQRGFTVQQLAERLGCSYQQVTRLERGQRRLSQEWMERIATALSCRPAALIEKEPPEGLEETLIPFHAEPEHTRAHPSIVKVEDTFYLRGETPFSEKLYALEVRDNSLNLSGILAGDIVISELDAPCRINDIVVVQHYTDNDARTILRRYEPPMLLPHATETGYTNFRADDGNIRIVSPVIKLVRLLG